MLNRFFAKSLTGDGDGVSSGDATPHKKRAKLGAKTAGRAEHGGSPSDEEDDDEVAVFPVTMEQ